MSEAYKRVMANKGSAGVDGIEVGDFKAYVARTWDQTKESILKETYVPKAVRRVAIPKPNGGTRTLGIPTLEDRMIQQAISQKLVELYDRDFSERSYGFRPGRSAHQAVLKAKEYINEGYDHVVEMDLENFFDTVNHDYLMSQLKLRIEDKRVLRLVNRFLKAGLFEGGLTKPNTEGTPQGGPLSPVLSNILLDRLDKELETRGHRFVRYADDISIYVKTKRAGERVMESVKGFCEKTLKLKVNEAKSVVTRPWQTSLLGYGFYLRKGSKGINIARKSIEKLKARIRIITSRSRPCAMYRRYGELLKLCRGWMNYFKLTEAPNPLQKLDEWIRARIRLCYWKQWKLPRTRVRMLESLGIPKQKAYQWGNSRKGYWRMALSPAAHRALTTDYLTKEGYRSLIDLCNSRMI